MSAIRFWHAREVEALAKNLIRDCQEFDSLDILDIRYVFRPKSQAGEGCKILASCRKLPGLISALTQTKGLAKDREDSHAEPWPVFVITVSYEPWSYADDDQKRALIHHELSHIDPVDVKTRTHTAEDFQTTAFRFGAWSPGLALLVEAVEKHETESAS